MTRDSGARCPHSDQLPALVNSHLPAAEASALQSHVDACPCCQAEVAHYRRLVGTLQALPPLAAPLGLREQILQAASHPADRSAPPGARREAGFVPCTQGVQPLPLLPRRAMRLASAALLLLFLVWAGAARYSSRYGGRTPAEWLEGARKIADYSPYLHVVGWVRTPRGVVPVEGWRIAGRLTVRIGNRTQVSQQGNLDGARVLLATWTPAVERFDYGEALLFLNGPVPPAAGSPRFHSRSPLVIALPRAGRLEQRVRIDPDTNHVLRVQLVGPDGRSRAALERLDYNPLRTPGGYPPGAPIN